MSGPAAAEQSGPSLRLVFGIMAVIVVVMGIGGYWRFTVSENHFAKALAEMDATGREVDADGCVGAVLEWHAGCEANKPLCDEGVPRVMTHCLFGRDRSDYCQSLDLSSSKAQWVFQKCVDRGSRCQRRKKCPCADAYRTIDSFCRHRQQGVSL